MTDTPIADVLDRDWPAIPTTPFRMLVAWFTCSSVVALLDHDGEVSVRIARRDMLGRLYAARRGFNIRNVLLLPNGEVGNGCYVKRWAMLVDREQGRLSDCRSGSPAHD